MCFRIVNVVIFCLMLNACAYPRQLGISLPQDVALSKVDDSPLVQTHIESQPDGPIIMNAIKDTDTGEMVATDVITPSSVIARFRNVAERMGYVSVSFDVTVPQEMSRSRWKLRIDPLMRMQGDSVGLEPIFITGSEYRRRQMRGYERYQAFLSSIIQDSTQFIQRHQLEVFLKRYFPETYAMKTDTSFISEPLAQNLFGVKQQEALEHYKRKLSYDRNERKKRDTDRRFRRYVKDPIVKEGVRLDTVLASGQTLMYRYTHTFKSVPGLRKVLICLHGSIYEKGEKVLSLPMSDELTFYISSMSTLIDDVTRYKVSVLERTVTDNTIAFIDFEKGSAEVDTLMGENAEEVRRIRQCITDVVSRSDLVLDSLIILATSSLEGSFKFNSALSYARSKAVCKYIESYVPSSWKDSLRAKSLPEDWNRFQLLVQNDTVLDSRTRNKVMKIVELQIDPDEKEARLARLESYKYLREKVYPKLRTVSFNFYLHRKGVVKDTIHTTEIDSSYMYGLRALKALDYTDAVALLRPYKDFNTALALASAGYDHSALDVLCRLDDENPKVCYLRAVIFSRMGERKKALVEFKKAVDRDPSLIHRANLDPEMFYVRNEVEKMF